MAGDRAPMPESYSQGEETKLLLRLYITRGASNSSRAQANLHAILELSFGGRYVLEVIDILENPLRAFDDGILVTPTLVKLSPGPVIRIAGDLSRTATVTGILAFPDGGPNS